MNYLTGNVKNLAAYLIVVTSGLYITKLPLSPIYFTMLIAIFFFAVRLLARKKIYITYSMAVPAIYFLYLLISQLVLRGDSHSVINVLMSICYFVLTLMITHDFTHQRLVFLLKRLVQVSIPLLLFEAYYRLTHPIYILANGFDYRSDPSQYFYPFKLNSVMYQDSNFVGIFVLTLFFLVFYLTKRFNEKMKIERIILLFLVFLTISRAAILSLLLFSIIFYIWNKNNRMLKVLLFFISLCLFIVVGFYVSTDESLHTKFHLLNLFFRFITESGPVDLLFGVGFGNTKEIFGMGAHNFIITHVVESGLIGFSILSLFWLQVVMTSKMKLLYVILPFLFAGMSLAGHAIPYLYSIFAIVILLERKNNDSV